MKVLSCSNDGRRTVYCLTISVKEEASAEVVALIEAGLTEAQPESVPARNFRPLSVLARDSDGQLQGGLMGSTYWGWLSISTLWVAPSFRAAGLGSKLVAEAEAEALRRGCHHSTVATFSFQAQPFYEKLGYSVFAALDDFPRGHRKIFLQKAL